MEELEETGCSFPFQSTLTSSSCPVLSNMLHLRPLLLDGRCIAPRRKVEVPSESDGCSES